MPLCAQEPDWHSNRSGGKQALAHMLCLTLGSRSNLLRVGRGHKPEGEADAASIRDTADFRRPVGYLSSELCICAAGFFFQWTISGCLTFQKPLESGNVSQNLFLESYEARVLCKRVRIQSDCCLVIKCEPNGKSKGLPGRHMQKRLPNAPQYQSLI